MDVNFVVQIVMMWGYILPATLYMCWLYKFFFSNILSVLDFINLFALKVIATHIFCEFIRTENYLGAGHFTGQLGVMNVWYPGY